MTIPESFFLDGFLVGVEEAGQELIGEGVDAVGDGGFLADEGAAATGDFAEVMIGWIDSTCFASESGARGRAAFWRC